MKNRETFYRELQEINKFYEAQEGLQRPGGMVINGKADVEALGSWGYDLLDGRSLDDCINRIKNSEEYKIKHPNENVDPIINVERPLIGPLRIENKLFRDDTGIRRVLFCSWFPALRIFRDNQTEALRQLDSIANAGYQGIRIFLCVGGWTDFWDGREVVPIRFQKWHYTGNHLRTDKLGHFVDAWSDYDNVLRNFLRECKKRNLRLHVATGDMQIICPDPTEELALHRRFARICAEEGGTQIIALAGDTNEYPLNRFSGDSRQSIEQMGKILNIWKQFIPNVLTSMGASLSEEPEKLLESITHGDICISHTSRSPFELCLKRSLGLVYWEGEYRKFPVPFWQGEPAGPGADSYAAQNDTANLTALYAMHALTGQASNWFQGAAVRSKMPLESEWGFTQMPKILSVLPEDIATWNRETKGSGAILYWTHGNKFATSTLSSWDPSPPRPVKNWTLYAGDSVVSGTGNPPKATGLLIGEFNV